MAESTNLASYYFHQGTNFYAYKYLGCNRTRKNGRFVYTFRTWAPHASDVSLVGDFTDWENGIKMNRITSGGIWEIEFITDGSIEKQAYKYKIASSSGTVMKGDPYAAMSRGFDDGASLVYTSDYKWGDANWRRAKRHKISQNKVGYLASPLNIYEMHLGSFARHEDGSYYSYRELAELIVPYVKYMGYTHVEFMPIAEHPFDGSWGYQVCGFYAPTSRFGEPDDLKYLIDTLHKNGVGVIIDWVPAHFPKDEWGLYEFDGSPLYEYQGNDRKESRSWGTRFFDLGREEIQSFLISNALYFLREFHVDGLRVDAVASMIYLDYDRDPGEWVPNSDGTNENKEATAFLRKLNKAIFEEHPDTLMIAEESGSHGGITKPVYLEGLGFNLKWNMGFANDFYDYVQTDPIYRKYKHNALNFPIMYAFSENYILPISHDEVVHGKKSFIDKMFGEYSDKFKMARAAMLLIMTYPGKKLMFMGTEYAQFREWDYENSLEWFMLDYPTHRAMREYTAALNRFYLEHSELWELDFSPEGFSWVYPDLAEKNSVVYKRHNSKGEFITVAVNFSGAEQQIGIPNIKKKYLYKIFDSSSEDKIPYKTKASCGIATVSLPPYSGAIFVEKNADNIIKI